MRCACRYSCVARSKLGIFGESFIGKRSVVIDKLAEIIQSKKPCGKDYLIAGIEER